MAPPDTTGTVTMHVAKELSFEDVSVHSPGPFRRGDAMRALRENPTGPAFRRACQSCLMAYYQCSIGIE